LPQLKELCDEYGVDGVWIDGECWATTHDYGPEATKAFIEKTGTAVIPYNPGDAGFFEFSEFCRDGFRNYLRHYTEEMHRHKVAFR